MVVQLAARAAGHEPVEMDVDLLGAEVRIDELDLLAAPRLHRMGRTLVQMQDFEHAGVSPQPSLPQRWTACNILQP
jgi:hypothetical protein